VRSIELVPANPPACAEAVRAILHADAVILGPGSWFTSVIPHLLVPGLADALVRTSATVITVLNLEPQVGETDDFSPEEHLRVLTDHCPRMRVNAVIADSAAVADAHSLGRFTTELSARLVLAPVAATGGGARHDPSRLSLAIAQAAGLNGNARGEGNGAPGIEQGVQ
jgi:uncharacterized cofD-like protein